MNAPDIPYALLEFEGGENWKRPPEENEKTGEQLPDLKKKQIKPPKLALKNWEKQWFDLTKEFAGNCSQWRALVKDMNMAG